MLDQIAIFVTLLILWIGFRFLFRRWLWRTMASGRITMKTAVVFTPRALPSSRCSHLPFVPWAWPILLAASVGLFAFSFALSRLSISADRSNPPPS